MKVKGQLLSGSPSADAAGSSTTATVLSISPSIMLHAVSLGIQLDGSMLIFLCLAVQIVYMHGFHIG